MARSERQGCVIPAALLSLREVGFVTTREKLTTKELVRRALDHLPDDVTMPEVIERLNYLHHIQLGLEDLDAGRIIPHEEIKRQIATWLR